MYSENLFVVSCLLLFEFIQSFNNLVIVCKSSLLAEVELYF